MEGTDFVQKQFTSTTLVQLDVEIALSRHVVTDKMIYQPTIPHKLRDRIKVEVRVLHRLPSQQRHSKK